MRSSKDILLAFLYFFLSTAITWLFIDVSDLYSNDEQKIISATIAGGKWMIQILAAVLLLKEKKWVFIKNIGLTCLVGSAILLPYSAMGGGKNFFLGSLIISVLAMIIHYRISVVTSKVSMNWYYGWLFCLAVAITLQLTVVF